MLLRKRLPRRGSVLIESAFVYPVLLVMILGIVLLSLAVFRYQQVAHIAREAARWASVRGANRAKELNQTPVTATDVYNGAVLPLASGMKPAELSCEVIWTADQRPVRPVTITPPTGESVVVYRANTVSVTVTYQWNTGLFGTIRVSSTSVNPISY